MLTFDGDGARQGDDEDAAFHGKLPPGILPHGLPTVKEVQPAVTVAPQEKKEEEKEKKGESGCKSFGGIILIKVKLGSS